MSLSNSISDAITKLSAAKGYAYLEVSEKNAKTPFTIKTTSWMGRCWRKITAVFFKIFTCCAPQDSLDQVVQKLHKAGPAALKAVARQTSEKALAQFVARLKKRAEHSAIARTYQIVIRNLDKVALGVEKKMKANMDAALEALEKAHPIPPIADAAQLKERLSGGFYGQFVGDAIGVLTEFMNKGHIEASLPEVLEENRILTYDMRKLRIERQAHYHQHLERFQDSEWTDDTDQFLCILRAIDRQKKDPSADLAALMAEELKDWRDHGLQARPSDNFEGREHPECQGLGTLVGAVINHSKFLSDPTAAAQECWLNMKSAANGALMRTSAVALSKWNNFADLIEHTKLFCKVTHADPRCIASCVTHVTAMALALRGVADYNTIKEKALEIGRLVLRQELVACSLHGRLLPEWQSQNFEDLYHNMEEELTLSCNAASWDDLDLDEGFEQPGINKIGYTYKCLGSAFYSLKLISEGTSFAEVLRQLTAEGGDADTNGCVAGALMGARTGLGAIPTSWHTGLGSRSVVDQAHAWITS